MATTPACRRRIMVYDDNPDFGGHQMMSSYAVEALAAEPEWEVWCAVHPGNRRWRERLARMRPPVNIIDAAGTTHRFQGLENRIFPVATTALSRWLRSHDPHIMLCLQAEIEDSSRILLAAKKVGLCAVSYIPTPHRMAGRGMRLGWLRDMTNRYIFSLPAGYITISPTMERLLRERGTRQPITIVPNAIDTGRFRPAPAGPARESLGLPAESPVIGMVGRIEYRQKGQDLALKAFEEYPQVFGDAHLIFFGDGPDAAHLRRMIKKSPRRESLRMFPWRADIDEIYPAFSVLLQPSRFEGVPLVMLEALACGIPVVGSDRDGMHDWLPEEWLFPEGDIDGLAKAVQRLPHNRDKLLRELREKILRTCALSQFGTRFREALRPWVLHCGRRTGVRDKSTCCPGQCRQSREAGDSAGID